MVGMELLSSISEVVLCFFFVPSFFSLWEKQGNARSQRFGVYAFEKKK